MLYFSVEYECWWKEMMRADTALLDAALLELQERFSGL